RGVAAESPLFTCNFLFMCSGYFSYDQGYTPEFAGLARFSGRVVHPQQWTDDIDYAGKRVVVIGSGATAVTLVPEMAKSAAHVTMLQRSPTYVVSLPATDHIANALRRVLPAKLAYGIVRWKNVLLGMLFVALSKRKPGWVKKLILSGVRKELGSNYDIDSHFTPSYNPWDQRICLAPDGDLFLAIKEGRASVVTDQIESFTATGLKLKSGTELAADVIVTATGLNLLVLGGAEFEVDGHRVDLALTMSYKGMMYSGVPNLASAIGYTNASWTLKCDLTCEYVCRLLNHMAKHNYKQCTPINSDPSITPEPWINFTSGYVQRSIDKFPKQGSKAPWKLYQNYALDIMTLKYGSVEDSAMRFSNPASNASRVGAPVDR
ncbi:MAG: NAD(P)/FAD-dependent oxidoreductase, partial [Candidatus Obscuribacterales bacterium]|nr:NAD(P)/FAD-dependent oxidoreductase [Steroidobacteraceae bacterium]